MPTYDYKCRHCDHEWELFQSMTARPVRKCPQCGRPKAERRIGAGAGIIFRGSGFYQTDYRSDSYKKRAEADQQAAQSAAGNGKPDSHGGSKKTGASSTSD